MTGRKKSDISVIDPSIFFSKWKFEIIPSLHAALGVRSREVVDKEKTAEARKAAIAEGMSEAEAKKRIKNRMLRQVVIDSHPSYDFHEGDIFYRGGAAGRDWIQIIRVISSDGPGLIEAHVPCDDGKRNAYQITQGALADALRTGETIPNSLRIPASQSSSESLRLLINQPDLDLSVSPPVSQASLFAHDPQ